MPMSAVNRQSTSAGHDSRLLMLQQKFLNPLMYVGAANSNLQPLLPVSVPFVACSPIVCQPLPCKPRLRPVTSLQEAAEIHVVGNRMLDSSADSPLPSRLSAKQKRMPRKVFSSLSADGRRDEKPASSEVNKGWTSDIYIPTASSSVSVKPQSGGRKLGDRTDHDTTAVQQSAYCIDVIQRDGRLKIEHVENPRPLPPRHYFCADDDNDILVNSRGYIHSRPDSMSDGQFVAESELHSSRHFICEPYPDIAHSHSMFTSPRMFSRDSEQTFFRVTSGQKQMRNNVGNSRTVYVDDDELWRHRSGQRVQSSADKLRRRRASLKKAISDVDSQILHDDGDSNREVVGENDRALPCDNSSECTETESCSIRDKYVTSQRCLLSSCFYGRIIGNIFWKYF